MLFGYGWGACVAAWASDLGIDLGGTGKICTALVSIWDSLGFIIGSVFPASQSRCSMVFMSRSQQFCGCSLVTEPKCQNERFRSDAKLYKLLSLQVVEWFFTRDMLPIAKQKHSSHFKVITMGFPLEFANGFEQEVLSSLKQPLLALESFDQEGPAEWPMHLHY